jgi:DNA-binding IclR family transcriptional regulator
LRERRRATLSRAAEGIGVHDEITRRVATQLARAPTSSPTPDELARRLAAPPDDVRAALDSLVTAGIVERRGPLKNRYRLKSGA